MKQSVLSQRDLAQALAEATTIRAALKLCLERALEAGGLDCGGVYLLNRTTQDLDLVVSQGLPDAFIEKVAHVPAGSPRWNLVMTGEARYSIYQRVRVTEPPIKDAEDLRAFGMIPVLNRGKVIACFNLTSHVLDEIPPSSREAIEQIALQVGNALVRIQAQEDLQNSHQELRSLFDTIQDFIFILDTQGCILQVNQWVLNRLGYSAEELVGQPVLIVHPPEVRETAAFVVKEMITGNLETCRLALIARNGEHIPVETKVAWGRWENQPVLIGVSRDISERLKAESQLSYRLKFEELLNQIAARLINVASDEIDAQINAALAEIGAFEQVDRCYVFLLNTEKPTMTNTHEWCAPGIEPQIQVLQDIPCDSLPWWMEKLAKFETIVIPRVSEMPPEAGTEREILEMQNIQSLIVLPMVHKKRLLGFVGFDAVSMQREWSPNSIAVLSMFSYLLSSTVNRARVDKALRLSESRYRSLFEQTHDAVFILDQQGRHIAINQRAADMLGYSTSEALELTITQVSYEPEKTTDTIKRLLNGEQIPLYERLFKHKDGHAFPVEINVELVRDPNGAPLHIQSVVRDISQRKQAEDALRQSEARNSAMLDAMPDLMFRIRSDGIFLDFASSNREDLVVPREQIIGSHICSLMGDDTGHLAIHYIRQAITTGERQTFTYQAMVQGAQQHFEARLVANAPNEAIAIIRNISERMRLEEMKSDFINRATHDLRTPLTTILLMVRLLDGECRPEERQEYWSILKQELERERLLIEDLLMAGRLESNRWKGNLRPISPKEALDQSVRGIASLAAVKEITLIYTSNELPKVNAEPNALQQIFNNLLSNAIKFTPRHGRVEVHTAVVKNVVRFSFLDNGMGIPPEDLPHLFSRFFRGRNATEAEVQGSGIGLYIVKSIIDQFGGTIHVNSELNAWTLFEVDLPIWEETPQPVG